MPQNDKKTEGKQFSQSAEVGENPYSEPKLEMSQEIYPLAAEDFWKLKAPDSRCISIGFGLLTTAIGLLLSLVAKLFQYLYFDKIVVVEKWELISAGAFVIVGLVLIIIGTCFPNEKAKIMKSIQIHFANSPRSHRVAKRKH